MTGTNLSHSDAMRRIDFIINEARQIRPRYDQTVRMAFRVVSNFQSVGRDCGSRYIYENGPYRSEKAHSLILAGAADKKLHNEHQEPLKSVWDWIVGRKGEVTTEEVELRLLKWPMVVITREENGKIPKGELDPAARYRDIIVLQRDSDANWARRA